MIEILRDINGKVIEVGDIYHQGDKNIRYVVECRGNELIGKQMGSSSYAGVKHWIDRIVVIGKI